MASLQTLPADQRAVLALVLQRGRSYDEIAEMLSIDRAAVRDRALKALDALGPGTQIDPGRRALITDYLLGQLPARVSHDTRDRLAQSAPERAWARVIASELSALASGPLPEIPAAVASSPGEVATGAPARSRRARPQPSAPGPEPAAPEAPAPAHARQPAGMPSSGPERRTSRRGGAILLAAAGAAVLVVVLILILNSGGSSKKNSSAAVPPSTTPSSSASTTATGTSPVTATTATGTGTTSGPPPQAIGQINLSSPVGTRTKGVVAVFRRSAQVGILLSAQHVPPTTGHDAYAVWLFNSPSDSRLLGFGPVVGSNGRLSTLGALPPNASRYKQLLVTRETARNPRHPGAIVLQGSLANVPLR